MRPGCKMLAGDSFVAANFCQEIGIFLPIHEGRLSFQGWALAPGEPQTHTLGRLSLAALITLLLLDVASGIPKFIPKQRPLWGMKEQLQPPRWQRIHYLRGPRSPPAKSPRRCLHPGRPRAPAQALTGFPAGPSPLPPRADRPRLIPHWASRPPEPSLLLRATVCAPAPAPSCPAAAGVHLPCAPHPRPRLSNITATLSVSS